MRISPFALLFIVSAISLAQEKPAADRFTTDHYFEFERISNAQISPDGARIVYTRQQADRMQDKWDSSLWVMNADGSQNRFLAKGSNPRWSPDGRVETHSIPGSGGQSVRHANVEVVKLGPKNRPRVVSNEHIDQ